MRPPGPSLHIVAPEDLVDFGSQLVEPLLGVHESDQLDMQELAAVLLFQLRQLLHHDLLAERCE